MLSKRTRTPIENLDRVPIQKKDFAYQYKAQSIRYSIWSNNPDNYIRIIIFLGTVQIGKIPAWIAQHCPEGTVVVQGAPHWLAKDDGSDLSEFMSRFTEDALLNVLKDRHTEKLRIVTDSQATPNVLALLATNKFIHKIGALALIQPLGLNSSAFAGTPETRISLFKKRIIKNFQRQLPSIVSDSRLRYNHRQILRTVGYGNAKSNAQYNIGLTSNSMENLKKLRISGIEIAVVCGEDDMLFRPHEIQASIQESGLNIPIILVPDVPHSPLATRQGIKLLNKALEYLGESQRGINLE